MKQDTRQRIIEIASTLFYDKGYNLTGINEIIEEAGIAKATLYSHFRSKEDLFLAYLDAKDKQLIEDLRKFIARKRVGDNQLIGVLEFLIPFFDTPDFNGCWCIRSVAEVPKDNQKIRDKIKTNKLQFLAYLKMLVDQNKVGLHAKKREKLAKEIYLLYEGALTESTLHNEAWPIKMAISLLKDRLKQY